MVDLGFSYPGAVAAVGMLGTTVVCTFACRVLRLVPLKAEMTPRFYMTYIMPAGFFMAVTFQAGNLAYLYLSGKHWIYSTLNAASLLRQQDQFSEVSTHA
jgi:hypothetical protein